MHALVFDTSKQKWETSNGFEKIEVPEPILDEAINPDDADAAIIKLR